MPVHNLTTQQLRDRLALAYSAVKSAETPAAALAAGAHATRLASVLRARGAL